jgi:arginyl-tRNA synthetase
MNLLHHLQSKLQAALTGLVPDPGKYAAMLKAAQDSRFGDYQANCAMSLKKVLGREPMAIAQTIADRLKDDPELEPPEVAKPGFINLRLKSDWLAKQVRAMAASDRLGVEPVKAPRTIVIDYSSPNVAKPMHVGHLRSTIIGDALARLLRFLGHKVIADNHLGDWGTQFGILLYGYKHYLDKAAFAADPVRELARLYVVVRGQIQKITTDKGEEEEDPNDPVMVVCREETAKLHAGDPENRALWQSFMPHCLEMLRPIYERLDVKFDCMHGESFYDPMLADVVRSLVAKGIAVESQGALVIPFGEKEPPALVRKRDGAFNYTTSDLATIQYRMETWHPDAILYVVDFRQQLHFKQLFEAARRWGYAPHLEHISFGAVLGKDRKPIKTRAGGVPELTDLLDEAVRYAALVYDELQQERGDDRAELSDEELKQVYEVVGVGAVKYADLSQNRASDYVFDLEKMTDLDGNTATYMQYAYARNRSILRKGNADVAALREKPPLPLLDTPEERQLALQLVRFPDALLAAAADYRPSQITAYLWDLCKSYSVFFQNCPVLKAETPELRQGRLLLCDVTARVIQKALDLLGIRTLERM